MKEMKNGNCGRGLGEKHKPYYLYSPGSRSIASRWGLWAKAAVCRDERRTTMEVEVFVDVVVEETQVPKSGRQERPRSDHQNSFSHAVLALGGDVAA